AQQRVREIATKVAEALGARATVEYARGYPATINSARESEFAARVGERVFGAANVITDFDPVMGGEDFSYMLQAKPGAYMFLGQGGGPNGCFLHNPGYDFNDEVIPLGAGYLAALVEESLPLAFQPAHGAALRWAAQNDVLTLDPHSQNHTTSIAVQQHAYEGLTRYSADYKLQPALAESWKEISPTQVR